MVRRTAGGMVEQMDWTKIAERVELMETSTVALTVGGIGALKAVLTVEMKVFSLVVLLVGLLDVWLASQLVFLLVERLVASLERVLVGLLVHEKVGSKVEHMSGEWVERLVCGCDVGV